MGGLGSGRPNSGAPTCEGCLGIDLAWLRRRGMLQPGRRSALTWSRSGEQTGSITLAAQTDGVRLIYRTTDRDGAKVDVSELVPFTYTPTMFGGRRQWLRCLRCGRGCRKIYGGRYFRCRLCYRLRYASQGESRPDQRALDRARKIAKRLHDRWEAPPRKSTTSRLSRHGCAGRRTTASWSNTTSWKTPRMLDGPFAS